MNNYERISKSVYKMACFIDCFVPLPFEIAIKNKRERIKYIKHWLESEVKL